MTDISIRLGLPFLHAGQAQKEMSHNEALALLDIAVPASVTAIADAPPGDAAPGDCVIVGGSPTGAFAGSAHAIAGWTPGGWRFVHPVEGQKCWISALGLEARFESGTWVVGEIRATGVVIDGVPVLGARGSAIAAPEGGAVIDAEARGAIAEIIARLVAHGLVDTA